MNLSACGLWGMYMEHVGHTCPLGGICRAHVIGIGWALIPKKLFTSKWWGDISVLQADIHIYARGRHREIDHVAILVLDRETSNQVRMG